MYKLIIRITFLAIATMVATAFAKANTTKVQGTEVQQDDKKEKDKKKDKKAFNWASDYRPKNLTGKKESADLDTYILTCDTVWNRITTYRDSVSFFRLDTTWCPKQNCMVIKVIGDDGEPKSFYKSIMQGLDITNTGLSIVNDALGITALTIGASADVATNPLLAFTYGKCLKGGPLLVGLATSEVKEIYNRVKKQTAELKQIHNSKQEGSTDLAYILPMQGELPSDAKIAEIDSIEELKSGNENSNIEEEINWELLDQPLPEKK